MTRWVSSANATAAAQTSICMVTLCDLDFSTPIYLNDGFGTLQYGGNTYQGLGDYGQVDVIDESTEQIARSIKLTLAGVPSNLLTDAMTTNYQGKTVTLRIGLLDVNALTWVDNPEILWEGRMDYMTIDLGQSSSTISMMCEHRLNREPAVARYTDQDQQLAYPGDSFFSLIWQIPLATASWGSVNVQHPANVPPNRYRGIGIPGTPGYPYGPGHFGG